MNRDEIKVALKYVWHHPCFDDLKFRKTILGQMPDYENYLVNRAKAHKEREIHGHKNESLVPTYDEPLLNREQEQHCFRRMNFHKYLAMKEFNRRHYDLAEKFLRRSDPDRRQIAASNIRLVPSFAWKFAKRSDNFEDIIQDGNLIIHKAVACFDWRLGYKFCTYATWALQKTLGYQARIFQRYDDRHEEIEYDGDGVSSRDLSREKEQQQIEAKRQAEMLLRQLPTRDAVIVRATIMDDRTLKSVADEVNLSRERIRQLRDDAMVRIIRLVREADIKCAI